MSNLCGGYIIIREIVFPEENLLVIATMDSIFISLNATCQIIIIKSSVGMDEEVILDF